MSTSRQEQSKAGACFRSAAGWAPPPRTLLGAVQSHTRSDLHALPCGPPPLCSFTFALGNLTNAVGDVARAAGAISRARTTLEVALGPGALAGGLEDSDAGGQTVDASEQPGAHGDAQLPEGWQGDIEFRGVRFSHPGGWSLRNVSFTIPAGKTVALVGPRCGAHTGVCPWAAARLLCQVPLLHGQHLTVCIHPIPRAPQRRRQVHHRLHS